MLRVVVAAILSMVLSSVVQARVCIPEESGLPVSRHVQIDASGAPIFGAIVRFASEPNFLNEKEVVLTFDDGPSPTLTRSILDTLDRYCVKATFFPVGRMASAYPSVMKEIAARGHTIGGHTWSHPLNLRKLSEPDLIEQVEKGFAAIALATGQPIAPFFRFPGLNDDARALKYLQERGIATFSVDIVSDDSFTSDVGRLTQTTLSRVSARNRGILLFHDIKPVTAKALPRILEGLAKRGFRIVHMTSKFALTPLQAYKKNIKLREKREPSFRVSLDGLHGTIRPSFATRLQLQQPSLPPVTLLAPERKKVELASTRNERIEDLTNSISLRGWAGFVDADNTEENQTKQPQTFQDPE